MSFIDCDVLFLIPWFVFPYKLFSLGLGQHFLSTSTAENVTDSWRNIYFWRAIDPAVELSATKGEYFYGFMDDTSISESIFVDIEEQYFYPTSSEHPTRKKKKTSAQKSIVWRVWLHHCECGKSFASKYDFNQHISRGHDDCPNISEICSKSINNRQTLTTHKFIKLRAHC